MSYCTEADLVTRYGTRMLVDLTDRGAVATGEIDSGVVAAAIAGADAFIDGYLDLYARPMATVPPLLTEIALAVTIWRLHVGVPGEKTMLDYKDARATLEQIAKGVVKLSVAGVQQAGTGETGAVFTDRERALTPETMTGFI